jgi:hypothetical protein
VIPWSGPADAFYGAEFDFLAVDSDDTVALIRTAGFGSLPSIVLEHAERVVGAVHLASHGPNTSGCNYDPDHPPPPDPTYSPRFAKRTLPQGRAHPTLDRIIPRHRAKGLEPARTQRLPLR